MHSLFTRLMKVVIIFVLHMIMIIDFIYSLSTHFIFLILVCEVYYDET